MSRQNFLNCIYGISLKFIKHLYECIIAVPRKANVAANEPEPNYSRILERLKLIKTTTNNTSVRFVKKRFYAYQYMAQNAFMNGHIVGGVRWKPSIFNLEQQLTLMICNTDHTHHIFRTRTNATFEWYVGRIHNNHRRTSCQTVIVVDKHQVMFHTGYRANASIVTVLSAGTFHCHDLKFRKWKPVIPEKDGVNIKTTSSSVNHHRRRQRSRAGVRMLSVQLTYCATR